MVASVASMTGRDVLDVARLVTGRPDAELGSWAVSDVVERIENMTTAGLDRVHGTLRDGTPWSVIAKTLHPASCSPAWAHIPEEHHAQVLADLHWLDEPRVYRSGLAGAMPPDLRLPVLHRVDEAPECITLWIEDVDDQGSWDRARYRRSAVALGRLAGRWPEERAVEELGFARRDLARLFFGKICHLDLPLQAEDGFWLDPAVVDAVDSEHRSDLQRLAIRIPELLDQLGTLPHGVAVGDAAPDNLRQPADGPLVAIDWSYGSCGALGSDLAQLLAGRYESGAASPGDVAEIAGTILDGYLAGLAEEGVTVGAAAVEAAFATNLAVRSVFSLLVVEAEPDEAARRDRLVRRAALGRFGIDLAFRVLDSGATAAIQPRG